MAKVSFSVLPLSNTSVLIKHFCIPFKNKLLKKYYEGGTLCPLRSRTALALPQTSSESIRTAYIRKTKGCKF